MNQQEQFVNFVCDMFDELKEQFKTKNQQYGVDVDPMANFTTGALLRYGEDSPEAMFSAALDYEAKHVAHVYNHGINGNKVDESLKDIAIYSIIELYMLEMDKNSKNITKSGII